MKNSIVFYSQRFMSCKSGPHCNDIELVECQKMLTICLIEIKGFPSGVTEISEACFLGLVRLDFHDSGLL